MSLADRMRAGARARWEKKGPEYAANRNKQYQEWKENQARRARVAEEQRQEAWKEYTKRAAQEAQQRNQEQQRRRRQERQAEQEKTYRLWEETFGPVKGPSRPLSKERVKVIDKIQKLLRLAAGNTTPEESRTAATMAYKLIEEHKIELK